MGGSASGVREAMNVARAGIIAALLVASLPATASATPGGLNAQGCHNDRKGGTGYHCHRGAASTAPRLGFTGAGGGGGAFRNCSAARAAGAAPVRRGNPGYGPHLDRDGDGIGCE